MRFTLFSTCSHVAVIGLFLLPVAASAEQPVEDTVATSPSVVSSEPAASSSGIADIVVTAQRREERLQSVPISVTAIGAAQLSNSGIISTQDLATVTPALTVSQQTGNFLPRLRGVGASFGGAGIENSVATYIDGVYVGSASGAFFSLAGVERIEVLKGPQGTLFGRNATGGLVQIVTKKPSEKFGGMVSANYGNYDTIGGDAYVTGGLAPGLAMDFAGRISFQGDGYGRNLFLDKDTNRTDRDLAFRSQLLFTSDTTTARLAADYAKSSGSQFAFRNSPFDRSVAAPDLVDQSPWDTNSNVPYVSKTKTYGLSLTIKQPLPFADLVSITAKRQADNYGVADADTTPTDFFSLNFLQKESQFSQELQLVSQSGSAVSWLLGAYYFNSNGKLDPVNLIFGPPLQTPAAMLSTDTTQKTRSYAGFGQVTVPLGEATRLTGGLRYTSERKRYFAIATATLPSGLSVPAGQRGTDEINFKKLTWRLSVDHHFTDDVMVFASYNRGFKSGGFNPSGGLNDPAFFPEQLDAYEVGIKADLFDRKLRINPSFFYYDYQNIQVTTISGVSTLPIFINGPKAKLYGLDLDFAAQPIENLTLRGGLTLIHHRFGDFPGAVFTVPNPAPFPGSTNVIGNAKGNRIPFTADWSSTVAADYVVPTSFGKLTISGTYNHSDGYYLQSDNVRKQKPFDMVSGTIRVENKDGSLFASLWGRNLLKEAVLLQANGSGLGGSAQYQAPRTFGVTIGTNF